MFAPARSAIGLFRLCFWLAALASVVLIGVNSLTRIRGFSPDSMSYVDVARNFATGRGLSQSSLGFGRAQFSINEPIPAPFTAHAPGFSVVIAAVGFLGLRFTDAALLLPVVFLGLSLVAAFLLGRACYDEGVGWLIVALLLNYYPLRHVSALAWSESMGIFFVLVALWLLARLQNEGANRSHVWLIGLFSGLAFATRYPMAPLIGIACLAVVTSADRIRAAHMRAGWLLLGLAVSAGPVLARNLLVAGSLTGSAANPIRTPVMSNVTGTMWALSEYYQAYYLETPPRLLELRLLGASLIPAVVVLVAQRRFTTTVNEAFVQRGSLWVVLWSLTYLAFLIVARSITWFDPIDHRLTVPAGVGLVILWAGLMAKTVRANRRVSAVIAATLVLAALGREARFLAATPPVPRDVLPQTERLLWIQNNTTDRDLIIGDYTMDLPFFLRRNAITFEHYPYTAKPAHDALAAYLQRHCNDFDHAFLVVRDWNRQDYQGWTNAFGPFIADLALGRTEPYPEYVLTAKLNDSFVFRIAKPACGVTSR